MQTRPTPIFGVMYSAGAFGMFDPMGFTHHNLISSSSKKTIKKSKPAPALPPFEPVISQYMEIRKAFLQESDTVFNSCNGDIINLIGLWMFDLAMQDQKFSNVIDAYKTLQRIEKIARNPFWNDKGEIDLSTPDIDIGFFKIEKFSLFNHKFPPSAIVSIREKFDDPCKGNDAPLLLGKIKKLVPQEPSDNRKTITNEFYKSITEDKTEEFLANNKRYTDYRHAAYFRK